MSKTLDHATREIELLINQATPENRPIIEPFVREILALVGAFGRSGQSGGSAEITAMSIGQTVIDLCMQRSITPILDIEEDWVHVGGQLPDGDETYQHKRCNALFKLGKDGLPYYLNAIVWEEDEAPEEQGGTYGRAKVFYKAKERTITSYQYVKFPFTPKTFYIKCRTGADDVRWVLNTDDLVPVFKYYNYIDVEK